MPILDVEIVVTAGGKSPQGMAAAIADAAAAVFRTPMGGTWVRLHELPQKRYSENGGGPDPDVPPVFVRVLKTNMLKMGGPSKWSRRTSRNEVVWEGMAWNEGHIPRNVSICSHTIRTNSRFLGFQQVHWKPRWAGKSLNPGPLQFGWEAGIRTPITCSRGTRPTVGRPPNPGYFRDRLALPTCSPKRCREGGSSSLTRERRRGETSIISGITVRLERRRSGFSRTYVLTDFSCSWSRGACRVNALLDLGEARRGVRLRP
jgi:hypothetical protein